MILPSSIQSSFINGIPCSHTHNTDACTQCPLTVHEWPTLHISDVPHKHTSLTSCTNVPGAHSENINKNKHMIYSIN